MIIAWIHPDSSKASAIWVPMGVEFPILKVSFFKGFGFKKRLKTDTTKNSRLPTSVGCGGSKHA